MKLKATIVTVIIFLLIGVYCYGTFGFPLGALGKEDPGGNPEQLSDSQLPDITDQTGAQDPSTQGGDGISEQYEEDDVSNGAPSTGETEVAPPSGSDSHAGETEGAEQDAEVWVDVDQSTQTAAVMKGEKVVREMIMSSGKDDTPTPNGTFKIQNRGEWFYSNKYKQGAKYWVSFKGWGKYLFHSVPFNEDKQLLDEEAALLGQKSSHGCIRLSIEDARWFYENIPDSARVEIHD